MSAVCIFKTGDGEKAKYFLLLTEEESGVFIHGFKTVEDGVKKFENKFGSFASRGFESEMSALINLMTFQPSIVEIGPVEELVKYLDADRQPHQVSNISGGFLGAKMLPTAEELWAKGTRPWIPEA